MGQLSFLPYIICPVRYLHEWVNEQGIMKVHKHIKILTKWSMQITTSGVQDTPVADVALTLSCL